MSTTDLVVLTATIGVVAGLLARPLLSFGAAVYERITNGNAISGNYGTYDTEHADIRVGRATVLQYGQKVRIVSIRQLNRTQAELQTPSRFVYRGRYTNGLLVATYRDGRNSHRTGAIVLKLTEANRYLSGRTMYCDRDIVDSYAFHLRRIGEDDARLAGSFRQRLLLALLD